MVHDELINFILRVTDVLRDSPSRTNSKSIILPLILLRRLDCIFGSDKHSSFFDPFSQNFTEDDSYKSMFQRITEKTFYNYQGLDFSQDISRFIHNYIERFNELNQNVSLIFEKFRFIEALEQLDNHREIFFLFSRFNDIDLHPTHVSNEEMADIYSRIVLKINEQLNDVIGEYSTPRDITSMMVEMLFTPDEKKTAEQQSRNYKIFDPVCGTGSMLAEAQYYFRPQNSKNTIDVYGQEFNDITYAIVASYFLLKGAEESVIKLGNSLTDDHFKEDNFDYLIAHPPFGCNWRRERHEIENEYWRLGENSRFVGGLPRITDSSLLFLMHMISKFQPYNPFTEEQNGSRLAIVFNGSPLFSGGAGSGESEIRRWIIENDWLETIIALPEQMFYNTGIGTYLWILSNRKEEHRKGKIQLIDGRDSWKPMRKSQGDKRRFLSSDDIDSLVCEYGKFTKSEISKVFENNEFGFSRVTVERPLRLKFQITEMLKNRFCENAPLCYQDFFELEDELGHEPIMDWNSIIETLKKLLKTKERKWTAPEKKLFREIFTTVDSQAEPVIKNTAKGIITYEADANLRDFENIPLKEDIEEYVSCKVLPYISDAWIDEKKIKIGYEINFNRYFYKYEPPRPLEEIDADLQVSEKRIMSLLSEVVE